MYLAILILQLCNFLYSCYYSQYHQSPQILLVLFLTPVIYLIFFLHQLSASLLIFLLLVFRFASVYIMFSLSRVILLIDSALFHNSLSHLSFPFLNVSPLSPYFFLFVSCCILRCCGCRLVICAQCLAVSISTGMCLLPFLLQLTTESPKIIYIGVYEFTAFCKY